MIEIEPYERTCFWVTIWYKYQEEVEVPVCSAQNIAMHIIKIEYIVLYRTRYHDILKYCSTRRIEFFMKIQYIYLKILSYLKVYLRYLISCIEHQALVPRHLNCHLTPICRRFISQFQWFQVSRVTDPSGTPDSKFLISNFLFNIYWQNL